MGHLNDWKSMTCNIWIFFILDRDKNILHRGNFASSGSEWAWQTSTNSYAIGRMHQPHGLHSPMVCDLETKRRCYSAQYLRLAKWRCYVTSFKRHEIPKGMRSSLNGLDHSMNTFELSNSYVGSEARWDHSILHAHHSAQYEHFGLTTPGSYLMGFFCRTDGANFF